MPPTDVIVLGLLAVLAVEAWLITLQRRVIVRLTDANMDLIEDNKDLRDQLALPYVAATGMNKMAAPTATELDVSYDTPQDLSRPTVEEWLDS